MIMRGFQTSSDSILSIKQYERKAIAVQSHPNSFEKHMPVTFREADINGLDKRHNDPMVIEILVEDCEMTRVLNDTGSSVDQMFKETLKKWRLATT